VDISHTVLGSKIAGFSILPSSNPMHFDLKVTNDLVRMRGCNDGGPKLGSALAFLCTTWWQQPEDHVWFEDRWMVAPLSDE
jgi:hypothetical protein